MNLRNAYNVPDNLVDVAKYAKNLGVVIEIHAPKTSQQSKNGYYLAWLKRVSGTKGAGKLVLLRLLDWCDKNKEILLLVAHGKPLIEYYESVGFVKLHPTVGGVFMERKPK